MLPVPAPGAAVGVGPPLATDVAVGLDVDVAGRTVVMVVDEAAVVEVGARTVVDVVEETVVVAAVDEVAIVDVVSVVDGCTVVDVVVGATMVVTGGGGCVALGGGCVVLGGGCVVLGGGCVVLGGGSMVVVVDPLLSSASVRSTPVRSAASVSTRRFAVANDDLPLYHCGSKC